MRLRAALAGLLVVGPTIIASGDGRAVECTFSNPRYAGKCVEEATPADRQTPVQACLAILECLNDARCVKSYCNATTIRGGWSLDSPGPGTPSASARSATHGN